jgi:hypothetical protein
MKQDSENILKVNGILRLHNEELGGFDKSHDIFRKREIWKSRCAGQVAWIGGKMKNIHFLGREGADPFLRN